MRDPEVPKHQKKALPARQKKYGIEQWSRWFGRWCLPTWYRTEKARDQAFENQITKTTILRQSNYDNPLRKVDR
jgi:hypothetical protein